MASWLKRTFDYGKKGKVVVIFDDGDPKTIRKVIFTDPDGTERVFDRGAGTVTIVEKNKEPKTSTSAPVKQKGKGAKKHDHYVFEKEDWEIVVSEEGEVTWRRKASQGKAATEEKIQVKGKTGQGDWTHEDGTKDSPTGAPTNEDFPNPSEKPDKPSGGGGGKPADKPDKKPKKEKPKKRKGR
jgi:hypothetical protein